MTIKCKLCTSDATSILRDKPIRQGAFKKREFTQKAIALHECNDCGAIFLEDFCDVSFYEDGNYREQFNSSKEINVNQLLHDEEINDVVHRIGLHHLRGKSIADFGAGGGNFLDAVSNFASKTFAIEPAKHYHEYLSKNSEVYSFGENFVDAGIKVDIATSLSVIEHVDNPIQHVKELINSVVDGGLIYIKTPNFNDVCSKFCGENFYEYFIRISHSWYFNEKSMSHILKEAGADNFKIQYFHKYDIGNVIGWIKDNKPTGNKINLVFDEVFNAFYRKYIESKGNASHLWIEIKKGEV
ncbi:MAG: class I SAM-dependent methyltransferase [Victivallales bacterium]|nr:class I SAM-dependent methyltransferase [Victivallales bacterium]